MAKDFDDYPTPQLLAHRLVRLLPIRARDKVLEPHANRGRFVRAVRRYRPRAHVLANEVQPQYREVLESLVGAPRVRIGDFLQTPRQTRGFDWVIGNPPFSKNVALEHIRHSLRLVRPGGNVAMLLPTFYLHQNLRRDWWFREAPLKAVFFIAERPSFTGGGTDRYTYAWYWFQDGIPPLTPWMGSIISVDKAYTRTLRKQAKTQYQLVRETIWPGSPPRSSERQQKTESLHRTRRRRQRSPVRSR